MGMLDTGLVLAEAQVVTAEGDTASTAAYNAGSAALGDAGLTGENLWIQAVCSTTVTSAGAATVQAVLQDSADGETYADVVVGAVFAKAALLAGTAMLTIQPPPGLRQYWQIVWRVATAVLTAGKFDAYITNTLQRNIAQPSGFTVA